MSSPNQRFLNSFIQVLPKIQNHQLLLPSINQLLESSSCSSATTMEVGEELSTMATLSKSTAVTACVAMTLLYVAILYAPTLIFRLPSPTSYQQFMIRRFVCAAASSLLCVFISSFLLLPAPITEELVFRACMIPLLLCGGFKVQAVLLLCPMFFSLAHLNHLLEFYFRKNHSLLKTSIAVGTQLAYTMIFGSYASFLFIRTGHLSAPLVAHIVCNYMGLPAVYARKKGVVVSLAFISGTIAFVRLIFPLTSPALYNNRTDNCHCWHGYCSWS
ncbi:CAAX prenyl protease 2-like isoform X3 [Chenopodium quinoa]|uniref:CAAX prenyl protease 2-like isoform X3 n=1 Tax=Chenopodium quinoa TaxID=63459 RepID=UPI000B788B58|nr:CAAX prenyl protease 2-like isoform X3 [Chenopodium quinoa]